MKRKIKNISKDFEIDKKLKIKRNSEMKKFRYKNNLN